jgi:membrane protein YdbS with pleckstrin-like domain
MAASEPFEPDGVTWKRVSPKLAGARRVTILISNVIPAVVFAVLGAILGWRWFYVLAVLIALLGAYQWWLAGRQVRNWGYAEREDDLLVRHGLMFRQIVVVPYGRMQYVDVQAGPLDRAFGIAKVQLHTASAGTDAVIPGLPPEEAARLRDRLASRGQAQLAGL